MSLLDEIKRDREAGTPGPWCNSHLDTREFEVEENGQPVGETYGRDDETFANARRCVRVPDMEKALLAAEKLAKATDALMERDTETSGSAEQPYYDDVDAALAAYRAATE